jgi:hypothetical protein
MAVAAAAVIGLGAALPGLIQHSSSLPVQPSHHRVTVNPPRPTGNKLIFTGTVNGRKWRFALAYIDHRIMLNRPDGSSSPAPELGTGRDPATLTGFTEDSLAGVAGPVREDVARLTERLADGTVLRLRPVRWHGARWVGLVVPQHLGMGRLTAYARGGTEIAHAVPFGATAYVGWLRPGERGLPRQKVVIGSGTLDGKPWTETANSGPWGICIENGQAAYCDSGNGSALPRGDLVGSQSCDRPGGLGAGQAATAVRSLRLRFSDDSVQHVPAVSVAGRRYFAFSIPAKSKVTKWTAYDAAGQRLGSGNGRGIGWGVC